MKFATWFTALWAAFIVVLGALTPAHSQLGIFGTSTQCGPTAVGATATAVTFPASGTGPSVPHSAVVIQAPTTGYLCVNPFPGGTAAVSGSGCAAGSFYTAALGTPLVFSSPAPSQLSVVASAGATPMSCAYQ